MMSKETEERFNEIHEQARRSREKIHEFHEQFTQKMRDEGGYIDIPRVKSVEHLRELIEKDREYSKKKMEYTDKMGKNFSTVNYTYIIEEIIRRIGYIDDFCLQVLMDLNYEQFQRNNGNTSQV